MPIPSPMYPLEDTCTTVFNNTLYAYTPKAFQSLRLESGEEWTVLPMGMSVTGGECVKSAPKNDTAAAALWIVGGQSNVTDYEGLQRFNFAKNSWETIKATVPVAQNRLYHGANYLNESDSILLFAGTQDGSKRPSSQTFTIKASEPFDVVAFEANVPPAISPLIIPWSQSKAIYVGGSETNTKVMVFSPEKSWQDSNSSLANGFYNTNAIRATVQNGNDASRSLYTFDMTVSPNSVNRTILVDGDGNAVANAEPVKSTKTLEDDTATRELDDRSLERRGNLTVGNWPPYNGSLVSSTQRKAYAVSRDQSGMTVIAGGSESDVLCIFKARDNLWLNATEKLSSKSVVQQGIGSSPSMTSLSVDPSDTASQPSVSSSAAGAARTGSTDDSFPGTILGAVLGSVGGAAIMLLVGWLLLRWRKKRRQHLDAGHQRRASGIPDDKNGWDIVDRGLPRSSSSAKQFHGHQPRQGSEGSLSSMGLLIGRGGHRRGGDAENGSFGSDTSSHFNKNFKTAISKPILQEQKSFGNLAPPAVEKPVPSTEERIARARSRGPSRGARRGSTRRSSGWNRYWSGGSAMNFLGFGSNRSTYGDEPSDRSSGSQYSGHRRPSQITQISAVPPPLNIGGDAGNNGASVVSSASSLGQGFFPLTADMPRQIGRPASVSTLSSWDGDRLDAFSSGVPESISDERQYWGPMNGQGWDTAHPSNNSYTESNYTSTMDRYALAGSQQETRFPISPSQSPPLGRRKYSSDMSWLNLGNESKT